MISSQVWNCEKQVHSPDVRHITDRCALNQSNHSGPIGRGDVIEERIINDHNVIQPDPRILVNIGGAQVDIPQGLH